MEENQRLSIGYPVLSFIICLHTFILVPWVLFCSLPKFERLMNNVGWEFSEPAKLIYSFTIRFLLAYWIGWLFLAILLCVVPWVLWLFLKKKVLWWIIFATILAIGIFWSLASIVSFLDASL